MLVIGVCSTKVGLRWLLFLTGTHYCITLWYRWTFFLHVCIYVCLSILCVHAGMPLTLCGDQRTTCRNWFSPSTLWALGMEVRLSGLAASAFTQWAISPPKQCFKRQDCRRKPGMCAYVCSLVCARLCVCTYICTYASGRKKEWLVPCKVPAMIIPRASELSHALNCVHCMWNTPFSAGCFVCCRGVVLGWSVSHLSSSIFCDVLTWDVLD